jgi:hypothetical protein
MNSNKVVWNWTEIAYFFSLGGSRVGGGGRRWGTVGQARLPYNGLLVCVWAAKALVGPRWLVHTGLDNDWSGE